MGQNKKSNMITPAESSIHIRRCHICGQINESEKSSNEQCAHCGKFFAPFVFFDECSILGLDDQVMPGHQALAVLTYYHELEAAKVIADEDDEVVSQPDFFASEINERHHPLKTQYPPLWGLAVYW